MSRIYYLLPIAIIASLLISLVPQPAAAAGMPGQHGISCEDGVCTLAIDLNGDGETTNKSGLLSFALPENVGFVPAGSQFSLTDDILLSLPIGDIPLENTSLTIQLDDENQVKRLNGSAALWTLNAATCISRSAPVSSWKQAQKQKMVEISTSSWLCLRANKRP